ncbi:MAG: cation:proton antiporter [Rhodospirillales bacterium]
MLELTTVVLVIAGLLVVIGVLQPLAERLRIPSTVLLAGVGVGIGTLASFLLFTPRTDRFDEIVAPIVNLPLGSATFLYVFLPLLLFQTALTIDVARMKQDAAPVLLLAIVAVIVTTIVVGFGLSWVFAAPLVACLLLGSVVATTDPAAVVGIFRDIGAPARLSRLVEGESLLNDAAAIVLFGLLLGMLVRGEPFDPVDGSTRFAISFAGGTVLGVLAGKLLIMAIRRLDNLKAAETTLTLAAPYIVYIVCDRVLDISGVVAVVFLGLSVSAWGKTAFTPENWQHLHNVWEQIAFWAGSLVFVLAAIVVPKLVPDVGFVEALIVLSLVVAALFARALVLFLLLPLLSLARLTKPVGWQYKTAILWGGLRGAVTLALALSVVENPALEPEVKRLVAAGATGFVLFTLFVNGTTLRSVIHKLRLDRLTPRDRILRDHILALSLAGVGHSVRAASERYGIPAPSVAPVLRHYEDRMRDVVSGGQLLADGSWESQPPIGERERLAIALVALANRERELIIQEHGRQTTSPAVAGRLLRHAERIVEAAQGRGRPGYGRVAREVLAFGPAFWFAHRVHRSLGFDGLLARQLEQRFEMLQAVGLVLAELRRFSEVRLGTIFGPRIARLTGEIIHRRACAISDALEALKLQYPAFAESLAHRFILKFALQEELSRYETLHAEGLLGREVYDDLKRSDLVQQRRLERGKRPRLDLGLKIPEMVGKVGLFAGLDAAELRRVARLFRSRLAVPGEYIVRRGDPGDRLYFVSSGALEVRFPGHAIRRGRGDFFGELAMFTGRRRTADVVALGYCDLLTLEQAKLDKFLRIHPDIKSHIEEVAKERLELLGAVIETKADDGSPPAAGDRPPGTSPDPDPGAEDRTPGG